MSASRQHLPCARCGVNPRATRTYCNKCHCTITKAWRAANPQKTKDLDRRTNLKKQYGMTLEDYDSMLVSQNGHCATCPRTPEECRAGRLAIDHDHKTGEVRALLCNRCNVALGMVHESADTLMNLATYVMSFRDVLELKCPK